MSLAMKPHIGFEESIESLIDRESEELVAKIISDDAAKEDLEKFNDLMLQRSRMMIRPPMAVNGFRFR
ncbi:hypothetical protein GOZ97_07510 [Agrobacterium vitis]|uniref:hypothetical protein n=1 Tax=Agrobacterium vitis TaxID=373 RepID=UPI0008FB71D2|nr:hypothetical protein [Agrobacterium vitis]MUZ53046.1 hypothetical protein [Agrobacterium vitis]MUZ91265.1 hypothetical protein [Agrobacterium vitis]MVA40291.1 hypothetical protein [Agrobacterium vitis]NSX96137.1 hypothetical protein [Agrobacterium vitis]NSZ27276.1 hypothetical protein [Agrobacterium vitis]